MSDLPAVVWIVFFTLVFPPLFGLGYFSHALMAVFLMLFPSLLSDPVDYLTAWFVFEAFNVASMLLGFSKSVTRNRQ